MRKIFADTGYWIALLNPDDSLHTKARESAVSLVSTPLVTSEMVFAELLNSFSSKGKVYREKASRFIEYSFENPEIEIIVQTDEIFKAALGLYKQRTDKAWSHTDCSSFYIMQKYKITQALAYDKHFEQAGFVALLR